MLRPNKNFYAHEIIVKATYQNHNSSSFSYDKYLNTEYLLDCFAAISIYIKYQNKIAMIVEQFNDNCKYTNIFLHVFVLFSRLTCSISLSYGHSNVQCIFHRQLATILSLLRIFN